MLNGWILNGYNKIQERKYQTALCFLMVIAIFFSLLNPALDFHIAEPEMLFEEDIEEDITILEVGEQLKDLDTIIIPKGTSTKSQEIPTESVNEETKEGDSESKNEDLQEEGQEDGNQGAEGENLSELDLAMVLTWYKYGNQPKNIVCAPSESVSKTINTLHLKNDFFQYHFSLNGTDAGKVKIQSIEAAEGDNQSKEIEAKGTLLIQIPEGNEKRTYSFKVNALVKNKNHEGLVEEQLISFTYDITFEKTFDVQLEMSWEKADGSDGILVCEPDQTAKRTVTNNELTENVFKFTTKLTGTQAEEAELISAQYRTASGDGSALNTAGGALVFKKATGSAEEIYYLTYTAKVGEKTIDFNYTIVFKEVLDVQLSFSWLEKGVTKKTMECQPEEKIAVNIKNNQLSAGALKYEIALSGSHAQSGQILGISYISDSGSAGSLKSSGSLPMTLPEGSSANTYKIAVVALVSGQQITFEIELKYTRDLSLEMSYQVRGKKKSVLCENGKSRTAEEIYDDQLTDGKLTYEIKLSGDEAGNAEIESISCYQSGSGKTLRLTSHGNVILLLKEGKTGQNNFIVKAKDRSGAEYVFEINIPYKHRGENTVKIKTNLKNNQTITNETKTNLTVRAWTEDAEGVVVDTIPANGTDTKLEVRLDGQLLSYVSAGHDTSEYDLYPKNPEKGDTNEHILYIRAEDAYGNYGELTLKLKGQRSMAGQIKGHATIYVDLSVLGLGVVASVPYMVLSNEPISYVIAKAILGKDTGEIFGAAETTLGWNGRYTGTLDSGFYLQSLNPEAKANTLEGESWNSYGKNEEEILNAIDQRFGKGTGLATLWRCIYRNGLNKSGGSGDSYGEHDFSQGSGWLYSIDGNYFPAQSMSAYYLQDGDVLTLRYTLAYGWDVGSGTEGYGNTIGYCVKAINGSFDIKHRMETITNADGSTSSVCKCCGLIEDCAHKNMIWKDLDNGFHVQYCEDCQTSVGDFELHIWENASENLKDKHSCAKCQTIQEHVWQEVENSNTATCTQGGKRAKKCVECGIVVEEEIAAKGHELSGAWSHDKNGHFQKCKICKSIIESSRGAHVYKQDAFGDYSCEQCGAGHDLNYCGNDKLVIVHADCKHIEYKCSECQFVMHRDGSFEEYHSYADGVCVVCQKPDPNKPIPEPETPVPTPEPEQPTPTPEPEMPTPTPESELPSLEGDI